jgi:hypothetical protein
MKTWDDLRNEIYDILDDCQESNGNYCPESVDKKKACREIATYIENYIKTLENQLIS